LKTLEVQQQTVVFSLYGRKAPQPYFPQGKEGINKRNDLAPVAREGKAYFPDW
jgi:hypothetical protein